MRIATVIVLVLLLVGVVRSSPSLVKEGNVVDMHTHSRYSDGADSAVELVIQAQKAGIQTLIITEHDQISIPKEAIKKGKEIGVDVQVGTEISCEWQLYDTNAEVKSVKAHMLGYFFNVKNGKLQSALLSVQAKRRNRNMLIQKILADKFSITDIDFTVEMAQATGGVSNTPGRAHFAQLLVNHGYAVDIAQAFERYLSDEHLGLEQWSMDCGDAAELIDQAQGAAVLAHPITLGLSYSVLEDELRAFKAEFPLSGLEVYSSRHSEDDVTAFADIATAVGLDISGGSDYHGIFKPTVHLGEFGGRTKEWRRTGYNYYNVFVVGYQVLAEEFMAARLAEGQFIVFKQIMSYIALGLVFYVCKRKIDAWFNESGSLSKGARWVQGSKFLKWFCIDTPEAEKPQNEDEMHRLIGGDVEEQQQQPQQKVVASATPEKKFNLIKLLVCVAGLQGSYLTWGFFQERIMTVNYGDDASEARFQNSEFLVFANRFWALMLSIVALKVTKVKMKRHCPVFKYSFSSMSNIMSSWFQYEALKYISFPMQGLAKSTKVVVTMLMGKFLNGKSFPAIQYFNASLITVGLLIFRLGGNGDSADAEDKEAGASLFILGMVMIMGYVLCDSFTSTWQSKLFTTYEMSSWHMMQGINLCSVFIGFGMLIAHETFFPSIAFMTMYPTCAMHALMMSVCSATGQMFIFVTISDFGPVVFATIMTFRQVISILLSMYVFGHPLNGWGVIGMCFVFVALFAKLYDSATRKKNKGSGRK